VEILRNCCHESLPMMQVRGHIHCEDGIV